MTLWLRQLLANDQVERGSKCLLFVCARIFSGLLPCWPIFRPTFRVNSKHDASVDNAGTEKASLTRSMASRCISGEFGGIAYRAGLDPECLRLGVTANAIQYHIDRMEPAAAAARAAERARVATETSAAEAAHARSRSSSSSGVGRPQRRRRSRPQSA